MGNMSGYRASRATPQALTRRRIGSQTTKRSGFRRSASRRAGHTLFNQVETPSPEKGSERRRGASPGVVEHRVRLIDVSACGHPIMREVKPAVGPAYFYTLEACENCKGGQLKLFRSS